MLWRAWKNTKNIYKTKKRKIINISYNQGQIVYQFKESEEFIDTLVKRLKMSKSTITFKISLYKLLTKYSLLKKHSSKSMHSLKTFFSRLSYPWRSGDQFENILLFLNRSHLIVYFFLLRLINIILEYKDFLFYGLISSYPEIRGKLFFRLRKFLTEIYKSF